MKAPPEIERFICPNRVPPNIDQGPAELKWIGLDSEERYRTEPGISGYGAEDITYHLNSLGYRTSDFSKTADFRIAVFGCEVVFGQGIQNEDLFHSIFGNRYAEASGKTTEVFNLGVRGAANDTIMRLVSLAVPVLEPDFVLINFAKAARREYLRVDGELYLFDPEAEPADLVESEIKNHFLTLSNRYADALNFYRNYSTIKHLLSGARWMFSSMDRWVIEELGPRLDRVRFVGVFADLDKARDGVSPGRLSHQQMSESFLQAALSQDAP